MPLPCEFLEWDTNFFGLRIARVSKNRLTIDRIREINDWCLERNIKCAYFLAPLDHRETIRLAEENGFRLMDVRITFEILCSDIDETFIDNEPRALIRSVVAEDINPLKDVSREIFKCTRFYFDTKFPRDRVRAMYEVWLEKSCRSSADSVFVAEIDDAPVGYITCHLDESNKSGNVGLIGVALKYQGTGIGRKLIQHALRWYSESKVQRVTIVTQGRNIEAQMLFQRCGFRTRDVRLWFHKWFANGGGNK
jgi:dTDP-4-amino-4,6-dideoxy-D-galactose acyltransferase